MKSVFLGLTALAVIISTGCKTNRARGDRETIPAEKVAPRETTRNDREGTRILLSEKRSQRDSFATKLAIIEREQKQLEGDPPSANRDQKIRNLTIKKRMLKRDLNRLDSEIALLEKQTGDLPSGMMTKEESEADALLSMAEEDDTRQEDLARAREAERRRRDEERRRGEEKRRLEEEARREAETTPAVKTDVEVKAGTASPFEERYAARILRIRTKLATYKRW